MNYLKAILKNERAAMQQKHTAADRRQGQETIGNHQELSAAQAWERMQQFLQTHINGPSYNTWLRPCVMVRCTKQELVLRVPDETFRHWLKEHYTGVLCEAFKRVYRRIPAHLNFDVMEDAE